MKPCSVAGCPEYAYRAEERCYLHAKEDSGLVSGYTRVRLQDQANRSRRLREVLEHARRHAGTEDDADGEGGLKVQAPGVAQVSAEAVKKNRDGPDSRGVGSPRPGGRRTLQDQVRAQVVGLLDYLPADGPPIQGEVEELPDGGAVVRHRLPGGELLETFVRLDDLGTVTTSVFRDGRVLLDVGPAEPLPDDDGQPG